jgi:hypothetical protein
MFQKPTPGATFAIRGPAILVSRQDPMFFRIPGTRTQFKIPDFPIFSAVRLLRRQLEAPPKPFAG